MPTIGEYISTRSLGALWALTSRLWPFVLALGRSGLLDNVLHALRALRLCDPRNSALEIFFIFLKITFVDTQNFLPDVLTPADL